MAQDDPRRTETVLAVSAVDWTRSTRQALAGELARHARAVAAGFPEERGVLARALETLRGLERQCTEAQAEVAAAEDRCRAAQAGAFRGIARIRRALFESCDPRIREAHRQALNAQAAGQPDRSAEEEDLLRRTVEALEDLACEPAPDVEAELQAILTPRAARFLIAALEPEEPRAA